MRHSGNSAGCIAFVKERPLIPPSPYASGVPERGFAVLAAASTPGGSGPKGNQ